jgi:enoyl-CoA hydratase/carnithine racemase
MTEFEFIKTSQRGRVYDIVIDHPPVNALNRQTYSELRAAFAEVAHVATAHVVVVSGAGRGFCPGADMNDVLHDVTEEARRTKFAIVDEMVENLVRIPVPVIAKLHGFCLAAGMRVASYCDIRVASEETFFGMPEVDRGLTAGSGGSLRRLNLPVGLVREMIFTGARFSARQMLDAGFLQRAVPRTELDAVTEALTGVIAAKERASLVAIKNSVAIDLQHLDAREAEQVIHDLSAEGEVPRETTEGARSFLEKQAPAYGR